ncbi:phage regulatory CII family protein [Xanthobacter sp. TB0136]|uniref:phage regulatory CII family protein n=1 Tax=Xanthobacter sp. TB0136 TaxID=3459177 RepID=UPI004039B248
MTQALERSARRHRHADYLALKGATRRLVEACGGQESAATVTRVAPQTLNKYGHPHEGVFAPVDVVADLEADAGDLLVTRALATISGHVLVRLPEGIEGSGCWYGHIADVAQGAGEVVRRLGAALADDGEVSACEIRELRLLEPIRAAIVDLVELERALAVIKRGAGE